MNCVCEESWKSALNASCLWGAADLSRKVKLFRAKPQYRQLYVFLTPHLLSPDLYHLYISLGCLQDRMTEMMVPRQISGILDHADSTTRLHILETVGPEKGSLALVLAQQATLTSILASLEETERTEMLGKVLECITQRQKEAIQLCEQRRTFRGRRSPVPETFIATQALISALPVSAQTCDSRACRRAHYRDREHFLHLTCSKHTIHWNCASSERLREFSCSCNDGLERK